ncbi:MAG: hypothetical protein IKR17_05695 [Bacteroidales bacterium]|nr:hypothetical protein [Bacteroidales bacterium]
MKLVASLAIAIFICTDIYAQTSDWSVGVKGFVDTYHAMRTENPNDLMASRSRVRGELTMKHGNVGAFASANLVYNALLNKESGLHMRECFVTYADDNWDIRAGRQIITWGVADALRLTDIVSPMEYTEFLADDYDDIRVPVGGLRVRYSRSAWSAEVVALPVSSFYILPTDADNPWSINLPDATLPYIINTGDEPQKKIVNGEIGGRLMFFLSGIDFSLSALRTWNKMPVFTTSILSDTIRLDGNYRRQTMLGVDMSVPVGKFVVRAEVAEYIGEAQTPVFGFDVQCANSLNALIGIDWYAGNDWSLSAQYAHKSIASHSALISTYKNSGTATVRIAKELLNNTLSVQTFAYIDVTCGGIYNRLSADYSVTDQLHCIVGYDLFSADSGMFAMYADNSEVWLRLKYNF